MPRSKPIRVSACLATSFLLVHCGHLTPSSCAAEDAGCVQTGGGSGASGSSNAGATSSGAASSSMGGKVATAGATSTGGAIGAAGSLSNGGATAMGGSSSSAGTASIGATASGGTATVGGATSPGGVTSTGGSAGLGGAPFAGGSSPAGGTTSSAGATSMAGMTATTGGGPTVDKNGVPLAKPGDQKTGSREYLNLGDIRLLLNKWGSDELNCNTSMRVFVNADKTFGWEFNRGGCGGNDQKPDYPEIEFGIHPFGANNSLATSPSFSSTSVLPLQIKDITSASVNIDSLNISLQNANSWNIDFEFWLSQKNPLTEADPGVYAELITFWGWENGRWPCDKSGTVTAGSKSYKLCHQDDNWADGKWRYFQFWVDGGPNTNFSGKVDVKALLDWLVNTRSYSKDLWVTRFEVGSEIDDNTSGKVTLKNITFEVNGTSKSVQFAQ
jgi:hypothetical protein